MTDFWAQQDRARRNTTVLVLLFIAGVIGIVAVTYPVAFAAYAFVVEIPPGKVGQTFWDPVVIGLVTLVVLVFVGGGSVYKLSQLAGGGQVVALALGGRALNHDSRDAHEQKLLNVVEEMAIASGVPVPPVYVMDGEASINAFAAGYKPDDAVVGVTRGTMELLDRDELQGVIAHEFSHILNGDMRLNIRLIGVLHGILVLGLIGHLLLRSAFYSGAGRSRRSSKESGNAALAIAAAGLALLVIGYVGVFFGNLIKAAVSRQREYLADASAVQFTRYPDGIGNALRKIGGYTFGSKVRHPDAEEFSHMYFGQGVSSWMGGALATHPPLPKRIKAVLPDWDGSFLEPQPPADVEDKAAAKQAHLSRRPPLPFPIGRGAAGAAGLATGAAAGLGAGATVGDAVAASVGRPAPEHLAYAQQLRSEIPEAVAHAARGPYGARAVVFAMLIDDDAAVAQDQMAHLSANADAAVAELTQRLRPRVRGLDAKLRLPVLDLALGALRQMSPAQHRAFVANAEALIRADDRLSLFEWVLRRVLRRHLADAEPGRPKRARVYHLGPVADEAAVLLSTLAWAGHQDAAAAEAAYALAVARLGLDRRPPMLPREHVKLSRLGKALDELNKVALREKRKLITAAAVGVTADTEVTVVEAELLRAVADALGVPMPPLLAGSPVEGGLSDVAMSKS